MKKKLVVTLFLVASMSMFFSSCNFSKKDASSDVSVEKETENKAEVNENESVFEQFDEPKSGEEVATLKIKDYGDIKIRLFSKKFPKTVNNFVKLAENGYYDGTTFHRVINDFMIQGGDPTGTGAGGESIYGGNFEDEFDDNYQPFRGALCMANAGPNTNGSQFFIVQKPVVTEDDFPKTGDVKFTDEIKNIYLEKGGTPWLYEHHTVFGQVLEGYDVLDKIAAVETVYDKPYENDVVIEKIIIDKVS